MAQVPRQILLTLMSLLTECRMFDVVDTHLLLLFCLDIEMLSDRLEDGGEIFLAVALGACPLEGFIGDGGAGQAVVSARHRELWPAASLSACAREESWRRNPPAASRRLLS